MGIALGGLALGVLIGTRRQTNTLKSENTHYLQYNFRIAKRYKITLLKRNPLKEMIEVYNAKFRDIFQILSKKTYAKQSKHFNNRVGTILNLVFYRL